MTRSKSSVGSERRLDASPRSKRLLLEAVPPLPPERIEEPEIPRELIARRAYERWMARGCPPGNGTEDWLEAERELRAAAQRKPTA